MAAFAIGDVVQLKSGGPAMTVADVVEEEGICFCKWFQEGSEHRDRVRSAEFPLDALQRVERPPTPGSLEH